LPQGRLPSKLPRAFLFPTSKLNLSAFAPLISAADRYLAGWQAALLNNPMGRGVLVNAVLDALPTYTMAALLLPQGVIESLDARLPLGGRKQGNRLSPGTSAASLNLQDQNQCLLLKLLHRLHSPGDSSWARPCLDARQRCGRAACSRPIVCSPRPRSKTAAPPPPGTAFGRHQAA
jgi:hypothetical protein